MIKNVKFFNNSINNEITEDNKKTVMYCPLGLQTVSCSVNDEGEEITILINEESYNILDAELKRMNLEYLAGQSPRPFMDFDHEGNKASGLPMEFSLGDDGIYLDIELTGSGKEAILNKDYSYISPEFFVEYDDKKQAYIIIGLGTCIGSFVNDPAFRNNKKIAAKHIPIDTS